MNNPEAAMDSKSIWQRPSVIALVLANLVPLFGVMFWHWEVFPLLLLFWSENVIVGGFNVLKMLIATRQQSGIAAASGYFLIPFFCVHYGMFTLVHGVFVVAMFGGGLEHGFPSPAVFWSAIKDHGLQWAILGLTVSHGISFVHNFIMNGEFRKASPPLLMFQPYGRIFVLHITIIIGGGLMMLLGSPMIGLLILVLLKIGLDLAGHLRERIKFSRQAAREQTSL